MVKIKYIHGHGLRCIFFVDKSHHGRKVWGQWTSENTERVQTAWQVGTNLSGMIWSKTLFDSILFRSHKVIRRFVGDSPVFGMHYSVLHQGDTFKRFSFNPTINASPQVRSGSGTRCGWGSWAGSQTNTRSPGGQDCFPFPCLFYKNLFD